MKDNPKYFVGGEVYCPWMVGRCRIEKLPGWRLQRSRNSLLKYQLVQDAKSEVEMVVMDDNCDLTSPLLNKANLLELGQCDGRGKRELVTWASQWGLLGAEPIGRAGYQIDMIKFGGEGGLFGAGSGIAFKAEPLAILQDCAKIAKVATDLYSILRKKSGINRASALKDLLEIDRNDLKIHKTSHTPPEAAFHIRGVGVGMHPRPNPKKSEEWSNLGVQALSYLVEQALEENISIRLAPHSTRGGKGPFKYYWTMKTLWGALFLKLVNQWKNFKICAMCKKVISSRATTCTPKCRKQWQRAKAKKKEVL